MVCSAGQLLAANAAQQDLRAQLLTARGAEADAQKALLEEQWRSTQAIEAARLQMQAAVHEAQCRATAAEDSARLAAEARDRIAAQAAHDAAEKETTAPLVSTPASARSFADSREAVRVLHCSPCMHAVAGAARLHLSVAT